MAEENGETKPIGLKDIHSFIGTDGCREVARCFYDRVFGDKDSPWFAHMFMSRSDKDLSVFNQEGFLVQTFGGPPMHGGMEKDLDFILEIHTFFKVSPKGLRRWMEHMKAGLEEALPNSKYPRAIEIKSVLLDWFWDFGANMINCTDQNKDAPHNVWVEKMKIKEAKKKKREERRAQKAAAKVEEEKAKAEEEKAKGEGKEEEGKEEEGKEEEEKEEEGKEEEEKKVVEKEEKKENGTKPE